MAEMRALRGYNRRTFDDGNGQRRTQFHAGHIHYRDDATGELEPIDYSWVDEGTHWLMARASYRLRVAKQFDAPNLIHYKNRYEGAAHDLIYEPHSLIWATGRTLANVVAWRSQQPVTGVLQGTSIVYADAFGPGLDFEVSLRGSGFTKELVIRRRADLDAPPTGAHRLVLRSRYSRAGQTVSLQNTTGRVWNEIGEFDNATDDGFRLEEPNGRHSLIRPAYIVESDVNETRHKCAVVWTHRNGALWQAKILPSAVLTSGVYPLRADTVTSFYAGAGDGFCEDSSSSSWDTVHDATSGNFTDYTGTTTRVGTGLTAGSNYLIRRAFFPIDTSGLPDGDTITAATLYVKTQQLSQNGDNDGDDWHVIVGPTSQANSTQLVGGDYDTCGSVNSPQEVTNSRIDWSSIAAVGSYTAWALNATGLSIISKTGTTLLGMREGHDVLDSAYAGSSNTFNLIRFYTSEQAGTTDDPYLEVTHSASAPTTRAWFLPLLGAA